jgi:hypothetical protein
MTRMNGRIRLILSVTDIERHSCQRTQKGTKLSGSAEKIKTECTVYLQQFTQFPHSISFSLTLTLNHVLCTKTLIWFRSLYSQMWHAQRHWRFPWPADPRSAERGCFALILRVNCLAIRFPACDKNRIETITPTANVHELGKLCLGIIRE